MHRVVLNKPLVPGLFDAGRLPLLDPFATKTILWVRHTNAVARWVKEWSWAPFAVLDGWVPRNDIERDAIKQLKRIAKEAADDTASTQSV